MKKLYTISIMLVALIALSLTAVSAPDLHIMSADTLLQGGVDDIIQIKAKVRNANVLNSVPTKLKINVHEIQNGQGLLICWGPTCFPLVTETGSKEYMDVFNIPAQGDSDNGFKCDVEQFGVEGLIEVTFTFYNENNPADEASFTTKVMIGEVSVEESALTDVSIYPNPAVDYVNLILDESATVNQVNITNITGTLLKSIPVRNSDVMTIPVMELPNGIYFLTTIGESGIINSRRFIISR